MAQGARLAHKRMCGGQKNLLEVDCLGSQQQFVGLTENMLRERYENYLNSFVESRAMDVGVISTLIHSSE